MQRSHTTIANYTRRSGQHYALVREVSTYLGKPSAECYRLEHNGQPVFHCPKAAPVVGVLTALMLEDAR